MGEDINCKVNPLDQRKQPSDFFASDSLEPNTKFAYAWYVANNRYLCSALVALQLLKEIRIKENTSAIPFEVEYVAMYVPASSLDKDMLSKWTSLGGVIKKFEKFDDYIDGESYYR